MSEDKLKIAVIPGDGTGPEVTAEALKVLGAVAEAGGFSYELHEFDFGGERYLRTGEILPEGAVDELRAVRRHLPGSRRPSRRGARHPGKRPAAGAAISAGPVHQPAAGQAVSRASRRRWPARDRTTSTLSSSAKTPKTCTAASGGFLKKHTPDEVATQTAIYTRKGCERCIRWAFEYTRQAQQSQGQNADAGGQDQRADLRSRPVVADVPGRGQGISRRQSRLQPRRRLLHVDGQESRILRRDRHHQHVRRHHHRPGSHDPGRHGCGRRRQHQSRSGRNQHVRTDGRQCAEVHRPERDQSDRRHRAPWRCCWSRRARNRGRGSNSRTPSRSSPAPR